MPGIKRVHHIAVIASDYVRSRAFYCDVLGFTLLKETWRAERHSWKGDLALNGEYLIELFSFPHSPARLSQPEACGLRHLAFAVEDIVHTFRFLTEKGIHCEPVRIDPLTGKRFTFFFDPDNLPLELYQM